ncbi:Ser/Thr protein kinase RdoA (MazF antagonist) [Paenibacillus forsythiae]|uniref:Ser/Thr protein kinase RdoA (MazF antagonist) n=1 Tax=Paenibacillus forsythiae TaxID=365616 RepID=A0ABU3H7M3_9BACL|nr:phosphotransferase [Paenibacillus forsythiae]MDT3426002.1 Ser/Thr protein kinase RdoA (MazF antagonist) [Paenibacillus forsythiae]
MASEAVLKRASEAFQFDWRTLILISSSTNEVYRFTRNNQPYILRLSQRPSAYLEKIKAELEWISYLADNGVHVSLPIKSYDGQLTVICNESDQSIIAASFEMAAGRFFEKDQPHMWGTAIFHKWGETMGQMHRLSIVYDAIGVKRDDWAIWRIDNPWLQQGDYQVILEKLRSLEQSIASLPRGSNAYGLIHNDFHPYNFYIDNGDITVFDFDDSLYGWFALDIAIAAAHACWWGSPAHDRKSKNEFSKRFLNDFLTGYFKQNNLDKYGLQQIPMFMDYRNVCSFFWWLHNWDGDESRLSEFQQQAVKDAVRLIQSGQCFDGCDIQI